MKDDFLQIRLSSEDKEKIKKLANKNGLSLTEFVILKCSDNSTICNDNDNNKSIEGDENYIFNHLTADLKGMEKQLKDSKERAEKLYSENIELKKRIQETPVIEVGAFDKCSVNGRPKINVFVDWIGYSMFIRNADNLEADKERKQIYREVWDKHIKPMYKEFCNGER